MLAKANRLKGKSNFDKVFKKGEKFYSPYFVAYKLNTRSTSPTSETTLEMGPKVGIVASKKVGNATQRNHARRLISEALRPQIPRLKTQTSYVFICLKRTADSDALQINSAISSFLA